MHAAPLSHLLADRIREAPDAVFLRPVGEPGQTFADVGRECARWTETLRQAGVGPGDHVAVHLPAGAPAIHVWMAVNGLGATDVPVHGEYRGRYLAHVFKTTGARVAVVARRYVERLAEVAGDLGELRTVVIADDAPRPGELPFRLLDPPDAEGAAGWAPAEVAPYHVATVLFTSGTTGPSKAVMVTHAQLQATAEGAWPPGMLTPADRYYSVLPLYHVAAKQAVDAVLRAGAELVVRERFSTRAFWPDVRATGATATCLMGAMAGFLMAADAAPGEADNPLDKVLMLPLPPVLDAFRRRFGVRVRTLYNQTEISVPIASAGFDTPDFRSCGRLRAGYACRIVDEHDRPVAVGEVGELLVRADAPWTLMAGYLGDPQATARATCNLWLHTGDAFRIDRSGNYFFVDRLDDAIRRRGENISSVELEATVCEHPAVAECAAIGVRSEWSEEEVKIVVVLADGAALTEAELADFLERRLPRFMLPRFVELVDILPKTPTAKVRKRELRAAGVTDATWDRERAATRAL